jgi:hypothetical protein
LSSGIVKTIYDKDMLEGYPKIAKLMGELAERPSIARVEAEKTQ